MTDAYEFEDVEADEIERVVSHLSKHLNSKDAVLKNLKLLAGALEKLPQDVASLGSAGAGLGGLLLDKRILNSKHKDVKMYAAVVLVHLLRIYAPETPYEDDKDMEAVFDVLLWSVQQVQEYQSPMFELAVSVLQTISQTKSYFLLLDTGREDVVLDWVRTLLQCINAGSQPHAGPHVLEVLNGLVGDEGATDAVLEVLLSHLVPPRSQDNQAACQMAQTVLRACESAIKPQLQKFLTTLILSPISSNSDLHQHCYALIYQLYQAVPQVLLPVVPHITSELQAEEAAKRLEAVQLLCQLFSVPGNKLVCEYDDVLDALLGRFRDTQVDVRSYMVEFTPMLVAGVGSEERQQKVLKEAAVRLQDYDEKIRLAAVKAVCAVVRQLLAGPAGAAAGGTAGIGCKPKAFGVLVTPPALPDLLNSQEEDEAAAADLGVAYTPPEQEVAAGAAAGLAKDLPYLQDVLKMVCMRLRDTKPSVRKAAASSLMAVFRTVAAAGTSEQLARYCWLPARVVLCCKTDMELRCHLVEVTMKDGLLGSQVAAGQAACAWVQMWLNSNQLEQDVLMAMLAIRARLQADALTFLALRRKLSGKDKDPDAAEPLKRDLDKAARNLANSMPQASKAAEGLAALQGVRDNHVFAALQQALAPGATQQAVTKARADALSRVGSRSSSAEFMSQLLLWARPAAWLPQQLLVAMLELAAEAPDGEQGALVRGAYQLLQRLSKVAPMLFAGLLPELHGLLQSTEADLQQLGAQLFSQCARDQRKRGVVLAASANTATAALVKQQLLPCLRQLARGRSSAAVNLQEAAAGDGQKAASRKQKQRRQHDNQQDEDEGDEGDRLFDDMELGSQEAGAAATPRAAKWAVYGIASCQDSSSSRRELEQLADELVAGLDSGAPETAAKLQALATTGRVLPDAFARHAEQLVSFMLDDYLLTYLDAAATAGVAGGPSRSPGLLSPGDSRDTQTQLTSSSQAEAAAVWLKAAALKALAAGCVPDSDSNDVPVETQRAAARLAQDLEGLLDPSEEARPQFLADVPEEVAGQLRLAAAAALLRLARRHDARLGSSCYCLLGLVMQDSLEGVRAAFAAKVFKLVKHFNVRPSTHQLAAKYAAMLPLAAVDPVFANKEAAARQLKEWVHQRRTTVQQHIMSAAAAAGSGVLGGGSTLQDLPEMVVPYGLYILAHHPDFPQDAGADEPEAYTPFQFMLQFMLQPLLVASGGAPGGATAPALLKMCSILKFTADKADDPATMQLYVLCDVAAATIHALGNQMGLGAATLSAKYPGSITLPKNLYRPLDKEERVAASVSCLPPGFEVELDPEPVAVLAHASGPPAATAATEKKAGRGSKPRAAAAAALGGSAPGRGSKRKSGSKAAAAGSSGAPGDAGDDARPAKRSKGRKAAAGGQRGSKARRADSSDDGWESDEGDAPPSAANSDQLTSRQRKLQQQKLQAQVARPAGTHSTAGDSGADSMSGDEAHSPAPEQQPSALQQQQRQQQQTAGRQQLQQQQDADSSRDEEMDSQHDDRPAQKRPKQTERQAKPQQQQRQQRGRKQQQKPELMQQPLSFHAPVADASSPAHVRPRSRAGASAPQSETAEGDAVPTAAGAAAEPSVSPAGRRALRSVPLANGHAAANGTADGVAKKAAGHRQGKAATSPQAAEDDEAEDTDAGMLEDQTPQKDATKTAPRGKGAAGKAVVGGGAASKRRAAAARAAAAGSGGGRVTRSRAA